MAFGLLGDFALRGPLPFAHSPSAKTAVLRLLSAIVGRSQSKSPDDSSTGNNGFMETIGSCDSLPLPLPFESREEDIGRVLVWPCFCLCSSLAFSKAPLWPFGLSPPLLESTALHVLVSLVSCVRWLHTRSNRARTRTSAWHQATDHGILCPSPWIETSELPPLSW